MDDRRLEFGVGVLVLAAIGVGVILTFVFGAYPILLRKEYPITAKFPSVAGINVDTPVMKNGVRIGRVTDIELLDDGANLVMMIDDSFPLRQGEVPRIGAPKLVTGEARVEFIPASMKQRLALFDGKAGSPPDNIIQSDEASLAQKFIPKDGYYVNVEGSVASDPFSILMEFEDEIALTLNSIAQAGEQVGAAAGEVRSKLNNVFSGDQNQFPQLVQQASETIVEFQTLLKEVNSILNNQQLRQELMASKNQFDNVMVEAEETFQIAQLEIQEVGDSVTSAVNSVDRTVKNIEQITSPFANQNEQIAGMVMQSLSNLDSALVQIAYFGEQLNKSDGTIRRLMEDDELYFQVRRIAGNIEQLTTRVRPIVEDLRVAADKIGRDPGGTIGVRGAFNRRPSGAGYK